MPRFCLKRIDSYTTLCRDSNTGIAWVEDARTGTIHSCHPNIDATGSVKGMKKLGYWKREDKTVKCNGYIYNISSLSYDKSDALDCLAMNECRCKYCTSKSTKTIL